METLKDKIFDLFYIKYFKVKNIAKSENVSSAYITKVVKTYLRYKTEKELRKIRKKKKGN